MRTVRRQYLLLKPLAAPAGLKVGTGWFHSFKFHVHSALSFLDEHADLCLQFEGDNPVVKRLVRQWINELIVNPATMVANIVADGRAEPEELTATFVGMPFQINGQLAHWTPYYLGHNSEGLRLVLRRGVCEPSMALS